MSMKSRLKTMVKTVKARQMKMGKNFFLLILPCRRKYLACIKPMYFHENPSRHQQTIPKWGVWWVTCHSFIHCMAYWERFTFRFCSLPLWPRFRPGSWHPPSVIMNWGLCRLPDPPLSLMLGQSWLLTHYRRRPQKLEVSLNIMKKPRLPISITLRC